MRERGLKSIKKNPELKLEERRSREGAWIEIIKKKICVLRGAVAPVRERGLKLNAVYSIQCKRSRSREGAWIEIIKDRTANIGLRYVAPVRERGLKCAC